MTGPLQQETLPAKARIELLLRRFTRAAQAHHAALEALDAERAETQVRLLAALHESLASWGEPGTEKLLQLADSCDPAVAGMAAVYSLHRDRGRCLATLRRVAAEPGLLGFRASMVLERWEAGEWESPALPSALVRQQNSPLRLD